MASQTRDYAMGGQGIQINTNPSNIDLEARPDLLSPLSPTESVRNRKVARSNTVKTYGPKRKGRDWQPGSEPGIDVLSMGQSRTDLSQVYEKCDITVVDFSQDDVKLHELTNETLAPFLNEPRPTWADGRWINVNGLSWDVVETLGKDKYLHRLAIEDLMNPRNRTKADWYSDHLFMVLPLQKLIHFHPGDESDSDCSECGDHDLDEKKSRRKKRRRWPFLNRRQKDHHENPLDHSEKLENANGTGPANLPPSARKPEAKARTLQRYLGGPNEERILFMEKHSALAPRGLGVGVEQVSIFLTTDNTVISFFESSADDIEGPLITRLCTPETILRRSSDASMIAQVSEYLLQYILSMH